MFVEKSERKKPSLTSLRRPHHFCQLSLFHKLASIITADHAATLIVASFANNTHHMGWQSDEAVQRAQLNLIVEAVRRLLPPSQYSGPCVYSIG